MNELPSDLAAVVDEVRVWASKNGIVVIEEFEPMQDADLIWHGDTPLDEFLVAAKSADSPSVFLSTMLFNVDDLNFMIGDAIGTDPDELDDAAVEDLCRRSPKLADLRARLARAIGMPTVLQIQWRGDGKTNLLAVEAKWFLAFCDLTSGPDATSFREGA
jgi:hypothetical protein